MSKLKEFLEPVGMGMAMFFIFIVAPLMLCGGIAWIVKLMVTP